MAGGDPGVGTGSLLIGTETHGCFSQRPEGTDHRPLCLISAPCPSPFSSVIPSSLCPVWRPKGPQGLAPRPDPSPFGPPRSVFLLSSNHL